MALHYLVFKYICLSVSTCTSYSIKKKHDRNEGLFLTRLTSVDTVARYLTLIGTRTHVLPSPYLYIYLLKWFTIYRSVCEWPLRRKKLSSHKSWVGGPLSLFD